MTIDHHETFDILDSSKLCTYLDCPRQYFFEYVLAWRRDSPNNHLTFGTAWHDAMEHLLLNGYDDESVMAAYERFLTTYREVFPPESDELYEPKTPSNALKALAQYAQLYSRDPSEFSVLYTEISGTVPIDSSRVLHFRLDSICQDLTTNQYFSLEHKTGSRITRQWSQQWELAVALGTYTHVLYCLYEPHEIFGVRINGTFFQKSKIEFLRVPVRKTPPTMQQWLWTVGEWYDLLERDFESLYDVSPDDSILECFPQNPQACTKYFGCTYHDFCSAWQNPLQHADEPPPGYHIEYWDPRQRESTHTMNL